MARRIKLQAGISRKEHYRAARKLSMKHPGKIVLAHAWGPQKRFLILTTRGRVSAGALEAAMPCELAGGMPGPQVYWRNGDALAIDDDQKLRARLVADQFKIH